MAVIAGSGEPLGGDGPLLGAGAGLQDLPQGEPHGLLHVVVAFHLDVGPVPEIVEVAALGRCQLLETPVAGLQKGPGYLILQGRQRANVGPPVGDELDETDPWRPEDNWR